ncbi:MAG: DUF362 domain-containing protein [Candidatus Riflebacteria bacterium]|nr:DUF362 domain-containing protein [Candidatus Riflebacteria bacterium]MBR4571441.1 DUF362 domain-containing protein [Candidatus Riflebacteria bacterium]
MVTKVSLQKCESYDKQEVAAAVKELLRPLGGMQAFVKENYKVLIKPNMLSCKEPERAATTHPSVIEAVVRECFEAGASEVWVGDSPPAIFGRTEDFWNKTGFAKATEAAGGKMLCFEKAEKANIVLKVLGKNTDVSVIKAVFDADVVISLSKMKTHNLTRITGAVKNHFGFIPGFAKALFHKKYTKVYEFSAFVSELARALPVKLHIMDGIEAMDLQGPASGRVKKNNILIASESPVAVDFGFCKVVNLNPKSVPIMKYCRSIGWGPASFEEVEFVGTKVEDCIVGGYIVPPAPPVYLIPDFVLELIRKMIWTGPNLKPNKCVKCGRCKNICPAKAIEVRDTGASFDREKCISCFCCMEVCPVEAIEMKASPLMSIILKLRNVKRVLSRNKNE